jgi:putative spermidine/putrescine transport system permease protein
MTATTAPVAQPVEGVAVTRRRKRMRGSPAAWLVFIVGTLYFTVPLVATIEYSLRPVPFGAAYTNILTDPAFYASFVYSFVAGLVTIAASLLLLVPTAYWVRLRVPRLRPVIEFITVLPFVFPATILAFGLIRIYSAKPFVLTATDLGSNVLLICSYVILTLPFMYRAVDTGLAVMDVRVLTEAAQSLGAGWPRIIWSVIFPNLRLALLSGAFLTLAFALGEYTLASFFARPAFGPYIFELSQIKPFEPASATIISFAVTWLAMVAVALVGRGRGPRVQVTGAR